jgi:hypothetical protein
MGEQPGLDVVWPTRMPPRSIHASCCGTGKSRESRRLCGSYEQFAVERREKLRRIMLTEAHHVIGEQCPFVQYAQYTT